MAVGIRSRAERSVMINDKRTRHIETKQSFLGSHNGLRPAKMHIVLGNAGAGKSTLGRSMVMDYLANNGLEKNFLVWLSEESVEDFEVEFFTGIAGEPPQINSMRLFSEQDDECLKPHGKKAMIEVFETEVIAEQPEVIFLDNITTSKLLDAPFYQQGNIIKRIKKICADRNIALVVFAHTGGRVTDGIDRLIEMDDIRGGKDIVNLAEFFYIMQRFKVDGEFYPTIRVVKHRGQDLNGGALFGLNYNAAMRIYGSSFKIEFSVFKEIFAKRERL